MDRTKLKSTLQKDGIQYLLVQFVDIHGSPKVKMVPSEAVDDVADVGAGFAGGAVWGMGQNASSHDMMARIDPASYTPLPWKPGLARFASDLYVDSKPYAFCARVNLKRVLDEVRAAGYVFNVGVEPEHFLVVRIADGRIEPWDPARVDTLAKPCYDFKGLAAACDYLRDMNDALRALNWGVYQSDHEDANAQYEINYKYADALTTADRFIFFKMLAARRSWPSRSPIAPAAAPTCTTIWPTPKRAVTSSLETRIDAGWDFPNLAITFWAACSRMLARSAPSPRRL